MAQLMSVYKLDLETVKPPAGFATQAPPQAAAAAAPAATSAGTAVLTAVAEKLGMRQVQAGAAERQEPARMEAAASGGEEKSTLAPKAKPAR